MNFVAKLQSIIRSCIVDVPAEEPQVRYFSGRVDAAVPYREPQGIHFRPPAGAIGLLLSPAAEAGSAELICAQGSVPSDGLEPSEGGLHYAGTFALFVAADGTLHLGQKDAGDWVALSSRVDAELARIDTAITQLKNAVTPIAGVADGLTPGTGTTYSGAVANLPGSRSSVASAKVRVT